MQIKQGPMSIGDIFSNTFTLLGKTFSGSIIICGMFFIPAGILLAFGLSSMYTLIFESMLASNPAMASDYSPSVKDIIFTVVPVLLFFVCYTMAFTVITKLAFSEAESKSILMPEALKTAFSKTFLRGLGLVFFIVLLFICLLAIPLIVMYIGGLISMSALTIAGIAGAFIAIVFMIYLSVIWLPGFVHVINSNESIIGSLKVGAYLVKGNWWRVFGILILFSLIINFAASLVTTPVLFLLFKDAFLNYSSLMQGSLRPESTEAILDIFTSFGSSLGILVSINTALQTIATPIVYVIIYFDLLTRKSLIGPELQTIK